MRSMPADATEPRDLLLQAQSALDEGDAELAFELLRARLAADVDAELLNDMAVIAHAGGHAERAVHLLQVATLAEPGREDVTENLRVLEGRTSPEWQPASGAEPLVPHMTDAELALLRAVGAPRRFVVEFGCGGSTADWLRHPAVERVVSVESDAAWVEKMRGHAELADAFTSGRLTLLHADVGPTVDWGTPASREHMDRWPGYWSAVWESPAVTEAVDLVFVDGRFRVACALNAALRVGDGALIVMHDFFKRPHYHAVLAHLDIVARADELVVLRRREGFDPVLVVDALARHALDLR
jgi:hypothetical protein